MRKLAVLFLLISAACGALAQNSFDGTVKVAFGQIRNPDGSIRSIKGLVLPFHAERIYATTMKAISGRGAFNSGPRSFVSTTVYNADAGSGYGIIDSDDPTSLDDVTMAGGAGLPWENLTFGVDIAAEHQFLIRWRCYSSYTTGRGHDVSAFDGEFADFGVIFPATPIGTYKITIAVGAAGVVAPNNLMYMAQQFRTPQLDGNGPFDTAMKNVYNPIAPPSIGSSDNVFWYDWDPMNGTYAEDEVDYFGDTSYANMLKTLTVSGTQDIVYPYTYTLNYGRQTGGSLIDLWYSDDSYMSATRPLLLFSTDQPQYELIIEGQAPTTTANSLTFIAETGQSGATGGTRTIRLFNYSTNTYDALDTQALTTMDSVAWVTITNNPSRYVNQSTKHVKAMIDFYPSKTALNWVGRVDQAIWKITHP